MTVERYQSIPGVIAGEDLRTHQHKAVKLSTAADFKVLLCTAAGERGAGVLQNEPNTNQAAEVAFMGICKAYAGTGGVTRGDQVTTNASAKFIPATTGRTDTSDAGAANDPLRASFVWGQAMESAAADVLFALLLMPMGAVPQTAI